MNRKESYPEQIVGKKPSKEYREAKSAYRQRRSTLQLVKDVALIIIGILSAGFALKSFLLPNLLLDGGATGISILLTKITGVSLSIVIVIVNLPFVYIGYKQLGFNFMAKMIFAIFGLALCLAFLKYPTLTNDKLLVAVFGGFFLGTGIGFAIRGGGVLDGTEVLAIYLSRKLSVSIGDVIMVVNIIIFSSAAYLLGIEPALYSMLTYLSAAKTVDFMIEGVEEYTGVTIISHKNQEIKEMISDKLGRGMTVYRGAGGFGKHGHVTHDINILFTVITRLEISRLKAEINLIDEEAFVVMNSIKDTRGGMIKKRPFKH